MRSRPEDNPGESDGQVVFVDRILWSRLDGAKTTAEFCRAWLALQCSMIDGVTSAVVVLKERDTAGFAPVAYWPDRNALDAGVTTLVDETLDRAEPRIVESDGGLSLAYPVLAPGTPPGIVGVVGMSVAAGADSGAVLRQLQWGSVWLDGHFRRSESADAETTADRLVTVLDLVASTLSAESFADAARALVTEMAVLLECDRVSLGFLKSGHARVAALSHSSQIGGHMNLVRSIGGAMDEAIDQRAVIVMPAGDDAGDDPGDDSADDNRFHVTREHSQLSSLVGGSAVMTVPLSNAGSLCGAMTLERPVDVGFEPSTVELCKAVAMAVGPMLETKRREDRSIVVKALDAAGGSLQRLIGAGYLGRKLIAIVLLAAVLFSTLATGEYRVSASSRVEGAVRRVVTAPVEGYVVSAAARPGDVVAAGEVLLELDDRDLRLERVQVSSERAQLAARLQDALARRERAEVRIISAQIERADAHIALLDEQIQRTKLVAPFDGIIVSGDLSQSLGAAMERGAVLYEIAPLDRYRVILEVDEHDIAELAVGQRGSLLLAALPGEPLAIEVTRLTPVASISAGVNYFRVEADLLDSPERVRPGMEGVGKIDIEERRLISIWTHKLRRWLTLKAWSWTP